MYASSSWPARSCMNLSFEGGGNKHSLWSLPVSPPFLLSKPDLVFSLCSLNLEHGCLVIQLSCLAEVRLRCTFPSAPTRLTRGNPVLAEHTYDPIRHCNMICINSVSDTHPGQHYIVARSVGCKAE